MGLRMQLILPMASFFFFLIDMVRVHQFMLSADESSDDLFQQSVSVFPWAFYTCLGVLKSTLRVISHLFLGNGSKTENDTEVNGHL